MEGWASRSADGVGTERDHRSFALVLSGGGARGFAHAGVLRGLEHQGYRPAAMVGVSMGSTVAATYALRTDWYAALEEADADDLPGPVYRVPGPETGWRIRLQTGLSRVRAVADLLLGWGIGESVRSRTLRLLTKLTCGGRLEDGRIPVAACATDLRSGERVVQRTGHAAEAVYASGALAGIFPPLERDGRLLVDGVYADIAPVDVARSMGADVVIAVDPGQELARAEVHNGLQALVRAMEVCQLRHADLRFDRADLLLRPRFSRVIDTLDFRARRECVAAGIRVVRDRRDALGDLLRSSR